MHTSSVRNRSTRDKRRTVTSSVEGAYTQIKLQFGSRLFTKELMFFILAQFKASGCLSETFRSVECIKVHCRMLFSLAVGQTGLGSLFVNSFSLISSLGGFPLFYLGFSPVRIFSNMHVVHWAPWLFWTKSGCPCHRKRQARIPTLL